MTATSYQLLRSHKLYMTSRTRDEADHPYDYTIPIPDGYIFMNDPAKQRIKVSLLTFGTYCSWTEVNGTNNVFQIKNVSTNDITTITIPYGNYPFYSLAQTLSGLVPNVLSCSWNAVTNRFVFNFPSVYALMFQGDSHRTLGFTAGDNNIQGNTITSTTNLLPQVTTKIYVRLDDVALANDNINVDNYSNNNKTVIPTNILCEIPVNAPPFQYIYYDNTLHGDETGIFIANPRFNYLHVLITDDKGNPLTFIGDWDITLKVEIFNVEDSNTDLMLSTLQSIDRTMKQLLTYKVINKY